MAPRIENKKDNKNESKKQIKTKSKKDLSKEKFKKGEMQIGKKSSTPSLEYIKREGYPDWAYIKLDTQTLVVPTLRKANTFYIPLKIDTSCAAVLENKFINAVARFLTKQEFESFIPPDSDIITSHFNPFPKYYDNFNFASSAGATDEISCCKQIIVKKAFALKEKDIIWINRECLPTILADFREKNILFDARSFAHCQLFLSNCDTGTKKKHLPLELPTIDRKEVDNISKEILTDTKFLQLKKAKNGYVYGHRPNCGKNPERNVPSVVIVPTFVKDSKENMYLVLNRENRPPLGDKKVVTFPAGLVDVEDGKEIDSLMNAASREFEEETQVNQKSIITNKKVTFLDHFASSASALSETFSAVLVTGTLTKEMEKKLMIARYPDSSAYAFFPSNTDDGVTDAVNLLKISKGESLKRIIFRAQELGHILNSQGIAALNRVYVECNKDFFTLFDKKVQRKSSSR